jgi:AcrR family transcriptional regulator
MTKANPMRRLPRQDRGQRRVNSILDAASDIFAELGYEASTTNLIATRANTSIGSLYQFFPNRRAILDALAGRYQAELNQLLNGVFQDHSRPLQVVFDELIDALFDYYAAHPSFQPMFYATQSSRDLSAVAGEMSLAVVSRVSDLFRAAAPALDDAACAFYAEIAVFTLRALIPLLQKPEDKARILPEIRRMVYAYLASTGCFDIPMPPPT